MYEHGQMKNLVIEISMTDLAGLQSLIVAPDFFRPD
jgi:hypothetical protein